jgi:hypothetical protein
MFKKGFEGMRIGLHDRWLNPVDTVAEFYAMHHIEIPATLEVGEHNLNVEEWYEIKFIWKNSDRLKDGICELFINNQKIKVIPIANKSTNGISYIHINLPLTGELNNGVLIQSINAKVE